MKLYNDSKNPRNMRIEMSKEETESLLISIKELSFALAGLALNFLFQMKGQVSQKEMQRIKEHIVNLFSLILTQALDESMLKQSKPTKENTHNNNKEP